MAVNVPVGVEFFVFLQAQVKPLKGSNRYHNWVRKLTGGDLHIGKDAFNESYVAFSSEVEAVEFKLKWL